MKSLYLIGSLRNPAVPGVAEHLRGIGLDIFDDWYAAGPEADDAWKRYEEGRGNSFTQALRGYAAKHVFAFDKHHLDRCDGAVLILPAGRSGHLELGYMAGRGKPTFVLLDDPDRWDVMYQFATAVFPSLKELTDRLFVEIERANPPVVKVLAPLGSPEAYHRAGHITYVNDETGTQKTL